MRRIALCGFAVLMLGGGAFAAGPALTADEMKTLLAKGLVVTSTDLQGGRQYTARITLAADGKLSGSLTPAGDRPVALSGAWRLKGAQLCRTLAPLQPEEICETWL